MATPIKRGDDNPQQQRLSYAFNFRTGTTITQEFKGINQDKMITLWNGQILAVQSADLMLANGLAELKLVFGGSPGGSDPSSLAVTIDRWEMPGDSQEVDLFFHPELYLQLTFLAAFASSLLLEGLIISYLAEMRKGIEEKLDSDTLFTDDNFDGWTALGNSGPDGVAVQDEIIRFYELYLNGQTHYKKARYSLKHTTNAPNYWSRNVSDSNVNKILTTAQLLSEVQDNTLWIFPLPVRLAYKINALDSYIKSITPSRSHFMFGWLKDPSSEASTGKSRIEIQTNYVYDQWSTDVYEPA